MRACAQVKRECSSGPRNERHDLCVASPIPIYRRRRRANTPASGPGISVGTCLPAAVTYAHGRASREGHPKTKSECPPGPLTSFAAARTHLPPPSAYSTRNCGGRGSADGTRNFMDLTLLASHVLAPVADLGGGIKGS